MSSAQVSIYLPEHYKPLKDKNIPLCPLCFEVIVIPSYLSSCTKHIFCLNCLLISLRESLQYSCPICNKVGPIIIHDFNLQRRIEKCARKNPALSDIYNERKIANCPPINFAVFQLSSYEKDEETNSHKRTRL